MFFAKLLGVSYVMNLLREVAAELAEPGCARQCQAPLLTPI